MFPAAEKSLLHGTVVAGVARYLQRSVRVICHKLGGALAKVLAGSLANVCFMLTRCFKLKVLGKEKISCRVCILLYYLLLYTYYTHQQLGLFFLLKFPIKRANLLFGITHNDLFGSAAHQHQINYLVVHVQQPKQKYLSLPNYLKCFSRDASGILSHLALQVGLMH